MLLTPRLHLRPWREDDLPAMAAVSADPEVMRYFPATQTREETEAFIGRQQLQQEARGYCFFAAELRETCQVIGFIGLAHNDYMPDVAPCVEIGWRLASSTWGKGLAPEGAQACLDFGFHELGLTNIYAHTTVANLPSRRVMEKIGMTLHSTFMHPKLVDYPEIEECVLYGISAETAETFAAALPN